MGINVYLWNHYVGALVKTDQGIAFEYDSKFKKLDLEISPINLQTDGKEVFLNEPDWKETGGIPGVIYDSLPDRFGNDLLKTYFNEKGLTEKDIDIFVKLQYIGSRGMGALEFRPATETNQSNDAMTLQEIEKISILATKGKEALKTNLEDKRALLQILHIGTSAGGARAKALIAINKKDGTIKSGQIDQGKEYEYYLIKIDGGNEDKLKEPSGFGKLEYTYAQMAKKCEINMTECLLYNKVHFMTKRFDRNQNGEKMHIHSLCGILGLDYNKIGEYSYDHYFTTARKLGLGQDSMTEIFKRMVFNVLAHNCDDHTKNFSFMMNQTGEWSLSPAFDLCYSYDSSNEWVNGHNMRVNNKRVNINYHDLLVIGEKYNVKKRKEIIKKIKSIIDDFSIYARENNVNEILVEEVEKNRPLIQIE